MPDRKRRCLEAVGPFGREEMRPKKPPRRSLVAEPAIDNDEIRRRVYRENLLSLRHADEELAAGGEELLGDQDRERTADGAADNAVT